MTTERGKPVFIVSPLNRSGTNYLGDIICTIPGFEMPRLKEDYVLEHAALLEEYTNRSAHRWQILGDSAVTNALRCLGDGMLKFLGEACEHSDSRIVCKTPRAYGVEHFFQLFPAAKLLLLIRDGRDVVESAARSFTHSSHIDWMKEWRTGARLTIDFMVSRQAKDFAGQWHLIKYEDLVQRPHNVIPGLLNFLSVEADSFDWTTFDDLPVRGSSTYAGGTEKLNWDPVKKPADFQPVGRWQSWSAYRRLRFQMIAGKEMRQLGYAE